MCTEPACTYPSPGGSSEPSLSDPPGLREYMCKVDEETLISEDLPVAFQPGVCPDPQLTSGSGIPLTAGPKCLVGWGFWGRCHDAVLQDSATWIKSCSTICYGTLRKLMPQLPHLEIGVNNYWEVLRNSRIKGNNDSKVLILGNGTR